MVVYPDIAKSYFSAAEALEENGFQPAGNGIMRSGKVVKLFEKDEKLYRYIEMEHFNSTIFEIKLKNVTNDPSIAEVQDWL